MTKKLRIVRWISTLAIIIGAAANPEPALAFDADCDSGGPGSTGCSITFGPFSCSVTCGEGNYSCCNATDLGGKVSGCHCVAAQ
jgi:hypothetical protein